PGALRVPVVGDITFFVRGDANHDWKVDVSDAVFIFSYLFLGGDAPWCLAPADADDSGLLDLTDAVVILNDLFLGSPHISQPYPRAGLDPTPDPSGGCRS